MVINYKEHVGTRCNLLPFFTFLKTSMGLSLNAQENNYGRYAKNTEQMYHILINRARISYKKFDFIYNFAKYCRKNHRSIF